MLTPQTRLECNTREVAAKVFDGEAVLINLSTGVYYSIDRVGATVWEMIAGHHTVDAMVDAVTGQYDVGREQARTDVERLLGQLLDEKLISISAIDVPPGLRPEPGGEPRSAYAPPTLSVYRDMGDLLALDPPMPGLDEIPWDGSGGGSRAGAA